MNRKREGKKRMLDGGCGAHRGLILSSSHPTLRTGTPEKRCSDRSGLLLSSRKTWSKLSICRAKQQAPQQPKGIYEACRQAAFTVKYSSGLGTYQSHAVSWCRTEERPPHSPVSSALENLTPGQG